MRYIEGFKKKSKKNSSLYTDCDCDFSVDSVTDGIADEFYLRLARDEETHQLLELIARGGERGRGEARCHDREKDKARCGK